jgi:hypothetical protein
MAPEMATRRWIATLAIGCTALCACPLLAGCGAGSSSAHAPAYVARGDQICATQLAALARLPRPTTPDQAVSYLPHVLATLRAESTQLRALDPAAASEGELRAALTETGRLAKLLPGFLAHLRTGIVELTAFGALQTQSGALRTQIDAHFRRAGLTRCSQ